MRSVDYPKCYPRPAAPATENVPKKQALFWTAGQVFESTMPFTRMLGKNILDVLILLKNYATIRSFLRRQSQKSDPK